MNNEIKMPNELLNAPGDKLRLFAVWCARRVRHLINDKRSLNALDTAERYAKGEATLEELKAAYEEAKKVKRRNRRSRCANIAACYAALPDSLQAAYSAADSAGWAAADEVFNSDTQPKEWEAKKVEEWDEQEAVLGKIIGRKLRLFAVQCARRVQHLIKNKESLQALDVAERYARGKATLEELTEAHDEALTALERLDGEQYKADSAAVCAVRDFELCAALFSSECAAHAIATEATGIEPYSYPVSKIRTQKWMDAYRKEEEEQRVMLQKILATHMDEFTNAEAFEAKLLP